MRNARPRARVVVLLASTAMISASIATASWAGSPHPFRDANGVDLVDGSYNLRLPIASVGSGQAALDLIAYDGQTDNWSQFTSSQSKSGGTTFIGIGLDVRP